VQWTEGEGDDTAKEGTLKEVLCCTWIVLYIDSKVVLQAPSIRGQQFLGADLSDIEVSRMGFCSSNI
jgi:hypothetical protein